MHASSSQVFPIVDVECEEAHPRSVVIRLHPYAFVSQLAAIGRYNIEISLQPVHFDRLDNQQMLRFDGFKDKTIFLSAPKRKWRFYGAMLAYIQSRCAVEGGMEAGNPAPDRVFDREVVVENRAVFVDLQLIVFLVYWLLEIAE